MKKIGKAASFLTRYISIIILIFSAFAFWKPEGFGWATNYTSIFLGGGYVRYGAYHPGGRF